jgi:hypothetical protein
MDPSTQAAPDYYVWGLPGKPVIVHLHFGVIDRLSAEVMRGFGAIPKRGAEVGGVLLGAIEEGEQTIVRVEDFEAVACDYKRGPSYLFTADDGAAFDDACARWQPDPSRPAYAIGYFRSHTRDGLSLAPEDVGLLEEYFPSPSHIALMVKPFATKVSIASFFFREDGLFQSTAPLEFPFRRRELTGEEAPPRRSMMERTPRRREPRGDVGSEMRNPARNVAPSPEFVEEELADLVPEPPGPPYAYPSPSKSRPRSGWVWIPLSFVFLLLGVVLGFQAALTIGPKAAGSGAANYSLGLTVTREGANLSVKWDGEGPAAKTAQKGVLEIEDGGRPRPPLDLDSAQLRNGSILFTNSSGTVRFRLILYPQPGVTVTQMVEWKSSQ